MLIFYLIRALLWLGKLFTPPTAKERQQMLKLPDDDACPVCGWPRNQLRTMVMNTGTVNGTTAAGTSSTVVLQRTCARCGCRRYEKPLVAVTAGHVLPAIARTRLERAEDERNKTYRFELPPVEKKEGAA